ncbi:MAG: hypothetical protein ACRCZD_12705 [Phycicoccus sp.]
MKTYLGITDPSRDAEVSSALAAEQAAQAARCTIPSIRTVSFTLTSGSSTVTVVLDAADVGATVSGSGVPSSPLPTVTAVNATTSTLSAPATATGVRSLTVNRAWPADLTEALCRRVAHNLALRGLPTGVAVSMSEMAVSTRQVGGLNAEVARLEGPHRRITVG